MITVSKQAPVSVKAIKVAGYAAAKAAGMENVADAREHRRVSDLTAAMIHWRLAELLDQPETVEL